MLLPSPESPQKSCEQPCQRLYCLDQKFFLLLFLGHYPNVGKKEVWVGGHWHRTELTKYNTSVSCDDGTSVLFSVLCEPAHLSLSHLGWPSWVSPSPSRSPPCRGADPPSGQTRRPCAADGRTRSSRSSWGGRRTPERASQTPWGRSSPCSRCTWWQTTWRGNKKKLNASSTMRPPQRSFVIYLFWSSVATVQ